MDWSSFTGTLLLDENKTLVLLTKNNKEELIRELKVFAAYLKVDVEDQTTSRHYLESVYKVTILKYFTRRREDTPQRNRKKTISPCLLRDPDFKDRLYLVDISKV